MLEIRFDDQKLKKFERELRNIPGALPRVISRGLNRTASKARTELTRFASKKLGWKQKYVRPYIVLKKAGYSNFRATLSFPTRSIDIIHLKPKATKTGVSYRDPITGKRKTAHGAFIYEMPVRGRQVWVRSIYFLGRRKYVYWEGREIEALYKLRAPSLHKLLMLHGAAQTKQIYEECKIRLAKNVHDQVNLILRRRIPA
jgi:hypothetical protein